MDFLRVYGYLAAIIMYCHFPNTIRAQTLGAKSVARDTIFYDDFRDNRHNWYAPYRSVKNNRLVVESLMKDPTCYSGLQFDLDMTRDFEIMTVFSWHWNRKQTLMGFGWNYNLESGYFFGFNKKRDLKILKRTTEGYTVVYERRSPEVIHKEFVPMTLVVTKTGYFYQVYFNGTLIHTVPLIEDMGSMFGYFAGPNSEIRAHELFIYYID